MRDHLARNIYVKFWHKTDTTNWAVAELDADWVSGETGHASCLLSLTSGSPAVGRWRKNTCGGFYDSCTANSSPGTFCNSFKGRDPGTGASGLVFQDLSYARSLYPEVNLILCPNNGVLNILCPKTSSQDQQ